MVREAHLLLGDVEFLEVEDHLLLQPVAVHVDGQFREVVQNAGLDGLGAGFLEGHDLLPVLFDQLHAAQQVGDQDGAFLRPEGVELRGGGLHGCDQPGVLLLGDGFGLGRHDVRKAHDHRQDGVVAGVDARERKRVVHLAEVFAEHLAVDARRCLDGLRLDRDEDVDLAPLDRAGDQVADFVFRLPVDCREPQREVQLLGVQRAYLDRDFLISECGLAFAEAGH